MLPEEKGMFEMHSVTCELVVLPYCSTASVHIYTAYTTMQFAFGNEISYPLLTFLLWVLLAP